MMFRKVLPFALGIFCAGISMTPPASAASMARVAWVHNTVQVTRGGRWVSAGNGTAVGSGGYVRTGSNSRAQVHYADGTVMRLGSRSVARIRDARAKSVQLHRGKAYFKVKPQQQRMRVRTRTAVATVLGTEFIVSVDEAQNQQSFMPMSYGTGLLPNYLLAQGTEGQWVTQIITLEGLVGVSDPNGAGMIDLPPGTGTMVGNGLSPQSPNPVDVQDLRRNDTLLSDEQPGEGLANRPLDPGNPQQQTLLQQNTPGSQGVTNTSPLTGSLEVTIK